MRQITYISSARPEVGQQDIDSILARSRLNNGGAGITGLLLYDGRRFLQALEGPDDAVHSTFARIKADPRHRAVVLLSSREIDEREFGEWAMAAQAVNPAEAGMPLRDTVDALTAGLQKGRTRELFRSFARIERKVA